MASLDDEFDNESDLSADFDSEEDVSKPDAGMLPKGTKPDDASRFMRDYYDTHELKDGSYVQKEGAPLVDPLPDRQEDFGDEPTSLPEVEVSVQPRRRKVGSGESLAYGTAQGATLGFLENIAGGLGQAMLPKGIEPGPNASPEAKAAHAAQPSNYDIVRDRLKKRDDEAKEDHPWMYAGGELFGMAAPAIATFGAGGGAAAAGTLAKIGTKAGAKTLLTKAGLKAAGKAAGNMGARGAAFGGAQGFGNSEAETLVGKLKDAGVGAGFGAAGAVAGPVAPFLTAAGGAYLGSKVARDPNASEKDKASAILASILGLGGAAAVKSSGWRQRVADEARAEALKRPQVAVAKSEARGEKLDKLHVRALENKLKKLAEPAWKKVADEDAQLLMEKEALEGARAKDATSRADAEGARYKSFEEALEKEGRGVQARQKEADKRVVDAVGVDEARRQDHAEALENGREAHNRYVEQSVDQEMKARQAAKDQDAVKAVAGKKALAKRIEDEAKVLLERERAEDARVAGAVDLEEERRLAAQKARETADAAHSRAVEQSVDQEIRTAELAKKTKVQEEKVRAREAARKQGRVAEPQSSDEDYAASLLQHELKKGHQILRNNPDDYLKLSAEGQAGKQAVTPDYVADADAHLAKFAQGKSARLEAIKKGLADGTITRRQAEKAKARAAAKPKPSAEAPATPSPLDTTEVRPPPLNSFLQDFSDPLTEVSPTPLVDVAPERPIAERVSPDRVAALAKELGVDLTSRDPPSPAPPDTVVSPPRRETVFDSAPPDQTIASPTPLVDVPSEPSPISAVSRERYEALANELGIDLSQFQKARPNAPVPPRPVEVDNPNKTPAVRQQPAVMPDYVPKDGLHPDLMESRKAMGLPETPWKAMPKEPEPPSYIPKTIDEAISALSKKPKIPASVMGRDLEAPFKKIQYQENRPDRLLKEGLKQRAHTEDLKKRLLAPEAVDKVGKKQIGDAAKQSALSGAEGIWKGTPVGAVLRMAQKKPEARAYLNDVIAKALSGDRRLAAMHGKYFSAIGNSDPDLFRTWIRLNSDPDLMTAVADQIQPQ